jgi:hypothetical protein
MPFTQPVLLDTDFAEVRGNVREADRLADALTEFVRQLLLRFPGKETLAFGGVGVLGHSSHTSHVGAILGLIRHLLRKALDAGTPLDGQRYVIKTGEYQCKVSLNDEVPHYHPDTGDFHDPTGAVFPYEVDNTPTIRVFPRDSRKVLFASSDDTDDLRTFLGAVAARIGFCFDGKSEHPYFELKPDRQRFMPLRRPLRIAYAPREMGESCEYEPVEEEIADLLDP